MKITLINKYVRMKRCYLLLIYIALFSCNKESNVEIDASILPHFKAFEEAAKKRDISFNIETAGISANIAKINSNVVAQCKHGENVDPVIIVNPIYWTNASEADKEFYIFHELGHCFLKRDHLNTKDNKGNCKSMMHSSADACNFLYTNATREAYLDELFNK